VDGHAVERNFVVFYATNGTGGKSSMSAVLRAFVLKDFKLFSLCVVPK